MLGRSLIIGMGAVLIAPDAQAQRYTTAPSVAEAKCTKRIARFAATPRGRYHEYPDPWLVRSNYRQCYYGYTGQKPASIPSFASDKLFRLNAIIGFSTRG